MITTLTGENYLELKQFLDNLIDDFVKEYGDLALERIDGEETDINILRECLTSLPFLTSRKLVILNKPELNKDIAENLEEIINEMAETTDLIIVEPKPDKRLKLYKAIKKLTEFKEFKTFDQPDLIMWLVDTAKRANGHISVNDATYLIERVGNNQLTLKNDLDKLLLYNPSITKETIDLLTDSSPQSTIFQLLEAAFRGDKYKTLNLYNSQRELKTEPQQIIAMLSWQLQSLAFIKTASTGNIEQMAKETKLNPYVIRKNQSLAGSFSLTELKSYISQLLKLDVDIKTKPIDPDEALKLYLLSISC